LVTVVNVDSCSSPLWETKKVFACMRNAVSRGPKVGLLFTKTTGPKVGPRVQSAQLNSTGWIELDRALWTLWRRNSSHL